MCHLSVPVVTAHGAFGATTLVLMLLSAGRPSRPARQPLPKRCLQRPHPVLWVWSPQSVHEPLIPKWMYDALTQKPPTNRGFRTGDTVNVHPQTNRTYVLCGMLLHACNRRMFGKHRKGITNYCCQPRANNRGRRDTYAGRPKTTYIREDLLLDALAAC